MKLKQIFIFLGLMLILASCKSSLSEGEAKDLSAIIAKIEIQQNLADRNDNSVIVSLYDTDNNRIANKNIIIKANNVVLDTVETTSLYYTKSNFYRKENILVGDNYKFEITLTDNKTYLLGSVKPITEIDDKNIKLNETGDFEKDFVMNWHDLKEMNQLSISKSVLLKSSTRLEMTYPYEDTQLRKIGGDGKYVLPKSAYINSKRILSGVEFKFIALKLGDISKELAKGSEIKISGAVDKYVNFDEESMITWKGDNMQVKK